MDKDEKLKEDLGNVIDGLMGAIRQESRQNYLDNFAEQLSDLDFKNLSKWQLFSHKLMDPLKQHIEVWYSKEYGDIPFKALDQIVFVLINMDMVNANVERLVDLKRGCCHDKSTFIVRSYLQFKATNEVPEFYSRLDIKHEYWYPDFGSANEWFELIDGLYSLYYGAPQKYATSYLKLSDMKEDVLKEIEADENLARSYIPEYEAILERNKEKLSEEVYLEMSVKRNYWTVLFSILPEIKDGTLTDEYVLEKINQLYEKYFG